MTDDQQARLAELTAMRDDLQVLIAHVETIAVLLHGVHDRVEDLAAALAAETVLDDAIRCAVLGLGAPAADRVRRGPWQQTP